MPSALALIKAGLYELMNAESDAELDELVSSSAVYRLLYDEDTEELTVYFQTGSAYTYHDVPKQKALYFVDKASSKGKYLNQRIKNIYTYTRDF